jgi:hypothetical protein
MIDGERLEPQPGDTEEGALFVYRLDSRCERELGRTDFACG